MGSMADRRFLPRRVKVFPAEEVTTRDPGEVSAGEVGLDSAQVEAIWQAVVRYYRMGLHPALSMCLRYRGQIVLHRTIGHMRGNAPDDPPEAERVLATPSTLFNMFSASKAVTAMLVHLLDDRGQLHLDDAVAEYIPEFARHGKGQVTIRHVLTHRAGIPTLPGERADLDLLTDPKQLIALLCEARPRSVAGRSLAYHALTGGFVLGEIIERVTGKDVRTFLTDEVRRPLGMTHFNYGVRPGDLMNVAREAFTGPLPHFPLSWLVKRALGVDILEAVRLANDPRFLTGVIPAGNVIATAEEVCRFFELLRRQGELDGVRIFDRRTVRRASAEQSYLELDSTLLLPVRYGMGFMLGSDWVSFFGPNTRHAFGHLGFTNILAWADPDREISGALLNNGKPLVSPEVLLWLDITRVVASRIAPTRAAQP